MFEFLDQIKNSCQAAPAQSAEDMDRELSTVFGEPVRPALAPEAVLHPAPAAPVAETPLAFVDEARLADELSSVLGDPILPVAEEPKTEIVAPVFSAPVPAPEPAPAPVPVVVEEEEPILLEIIEDEDVPAPAPVAVDEDPIRERLRQEFERRRETEDRLQAEENRVLEARKELQVLREQVTELEYEYSDAIEALDKAERVRAALARKLEAAKVEKPKPVIGPISLDLGSIRTAVYAKLAPARAADPAFALYEGFRGAIDRLALDSGVSPMELEPVVARIIGELRDKGFAIGAAVKGADEAEDKALHLVRVARIALHIGLKSGYDAHALRGLGLCALLHESSGLKWFLGQHAHDFARVLRVAEAFDTLTATSYLGQPATPRQAAYKIVYGTQKGTFEKKYVKRLIETLAGVA